MNDRVLSTSLSEMFEKRNNFQDFQALVFKSLISLNLLLFLRESRDLPKRQISIRQNEWRFRHGIYFGMRIFICL